MDLAEAEWEFDQQQQTCCEEDSLRFVSDDQRSLRRLGLRVLRPSATPGTNSLRCCGPLGYAPYNGGRICTNGYASRYRAKLRLRSK